MLVSQTPPPGRTIKPISAPKHLRLVEFGAAILWTLAIVGAVADVTDHFPRGFVVITAVAAGTVTLIMVQLSVLDALAGLERGIEETAQLATQVQQLSAKLDRLEAARAGDREALRKDMAEAVAAVYRRGLVNGAQQLAEDAGRPPLRRVVGTEG